MYHAMAKRRAVFMTAFCLLVGLTPPAFGQDVTLSFPDGSFQVTGPLLGFDGQSYRVDTRFGVLTIAADTVTCLGACPAPGAAPVIRLAGSPLMAEVLVPALVDAFARSRGLAAVPLDVDGGVGLQLLTAEGSALARFEIRGPGTADGFRALVRNRADIVLADRHPTPEEGAAIRDAGLGDIRNALRRNLIARQDLRVYGSHSRFALPEFLQLALSDVPVFALSKEAPAIAARLDHLAQVGGRSAGKPSVTSVSSLDAAIGALKQSPSALFITTQSLPLSTVQEASLNSGCKPVALPDGPSAPYPLTLHFWTYTGEPRLPDIARGFLTFAASPEAQRVVDRAGFIDQRPRPIPLEAEGRRLSRAVQSLSAELALSDLQKVLTRLQGFERLPLVLRIGEGSEALSRESESLARGLASHLDTGRYDTRSLLFVGLTGSSGAASRNAETAKRDADIARQAVAAAMSTDTDRIAMESEGLGEVFPLACGPTRWAQSLNRRVEVWLSRAP